MKNQVFNPYLPLDVYILDGEPHAFGDRVYVYGSHDKEGGNTFCMLPYEVWSAPIDDLSRWESLGVAYTGEDDPNLTKEKHYMYAPDCVRGNDGRYYLYYCRGGYCEPISVAVSEKPDGPFHHHGAVHYPDGRLLTRGITFDPAVINDDGVIRLYYGAGLSILANLENSITRPLIERLMAAAVNKPLEQIRQEEDGIHGPVHVVLADDMVTAVSEPVKFMPSRTKGTQWDGHAFFEASSIRKINGVYYFLYSSWNTHDICYATSRYPDRDFAYRGVIISNGDIGIDGRKPKDRLNFTGNNHGGMVCIKGQWYIFYHRQTHGDSYNRQGCAEPILIAADGKIEQVAMTSCGLNGEPLSGIGAYPAGICCNLSNGKMPHGNGKNKKFPQISSIDGKQFLTGLTGGCFVGYKYFDLTGTVRIGILCRGNFRGRIRVRDGLEGNTIGETEVMPSDTWKVTETVLSAANIRKKEKSPLFLFCDGHGSLEIKELTLA